jgi:ComF family protein
MKNRFLHMLIEMAMPARCPSCGLAGCAYPLPVCVSCEQEIRGTSSWSFTSRDAVPEIWSLRRYEKAMRICLKELKYRRNLNVVPLLRDIASELRDPGYNWPGKFQLIIPVPGIRSRKGHSEIVSRLISEATGVSLSPGTLIKTRRTRKQARLSRDERLVNLSDAFRVTDPSLIRGRSVILTDDIMTTGATINECGKILRRSGASRILALTMAVSA